MNVHSAHQSPSGSSRATRLQPRVGILRLPAPQEEDKAAPLPPPPTHVSPQTPAPPLVPPTGPQGVACQPWRSVPRAAVGVWPSEDKGM